MKPFVLICMVLLFAVGCKKERTEITEPVAPAMVYTDLKDSAVRFGRGASFDLEGDGTKDIYFFTQLVGDPLLQQDKRQWLVQSSFYANLPVNGDENIPMLSQSAPIPTGDFDGYHWYNASGVLLAQKTFTETQPPFWIGLWKNAVHRFIPVQLIKQEGLHNGWIEVSFRTADERLVLHKAAVSKRPGMVVKAGE